MMLLNIFILLEFQQSADNNLFHSFPVLGEKELLCRFTSVKSCSLVILPVLILKYLLGSIFTWPFNILNTYIWLTLSLSEVSMLKYVTIALHRGTINPFSLYVIFLRIISIIWLPWEAAILHCSETFMLAIVTPKSLSFTVLHSIVHPISYFTQVFPYHVCTNFSKLNNICNSSDHLSNLSMSSCSCCLIPISRNFF